MSDDKEYLPLLDIENVLPILNKISIFAGLKEDKLYELFRQLEKVSYKAGEVIFRQGEQPSHIYIIKKGRVKLVVSDDDTPLELTVFEEGYCFGESSVIGIQPHAATAIALEDTELIVLSSSTLIKTYETDLELFSILLLNIARETCRRLHASDEVLLHYVLNNKKHIKNK
ncbi:MAG: cyclic nucleotide-binding domain-containing protein [Sedimentisphaerales bacterium]|nr:cyclic nucleotide-binding domain-containing protein [Sedimentisphaerales bacterium]